MKYFHRVTTTDEVEVMMMSSLFNSTGGGGEKEECIVNDQMGPFIVLYILIFISSLAGNLLSLWALVHSRGCERSIYVYLVNLLISDLLLTMALPFKIIKDLGVAPWGLMVFHCQASAVLIYISLYASIIFLTFITIDRYLQVSRKAPSCQVQVGSSKLLSVMVWIMLLLIMVPNMALPIQHVQSQQFLSCSSLKHGVGLQWHALAVFLCMALFLNSSAVVLLSAGLALKRLLGCKNRPKDRRAARRATAHIAALSVSFVVGFLPYHVIRTPYTMAQTNTVIRDCPTKRRLFLAKEWTLLLAVLHLCLDPLLYFCLWTPFRQTLRGLFRCTEQPQADTGAETAEEMMDADTSVAQSGACTVHTHL